MREDKQGQITGALVKPAIEERGQEYERRDHPASRQTVKQTEQHRGNDIGRNTGPQRRHKISAKEPFFRQGSCKECGNTGFQVIRLPCEQGEARQQQSCPRGNVTRCPGGRRRFPVRVEQRIEKHQPDEQVSRVVRCAAVSSQRNKNGAGRKTCAAKPGKKSLAQSVLTFTPIPAEPGHKSEQ